MVYFLLWCVVLLIRLSCIALCQPLLRWLLLIGKMWRSDCVTIISVVLWDYTHTHTGKNKIMHHPFAVVMCWFRSFLSYTAISCIEMKLRQCWNYLPLHICCILHCGFTYLMLSSLKCISSFIWRKTHISLKCILSFKYDKNTFLCTLCLGYGCNPSSVFDCYMKLCLAADEN